MSAVSAPPPPPTGSPARAPVAPKKTGAPPPPPPRDIFKALREGAPVGEVAALLTKSANAAAGKAEAVTGMFPLHVACASKASGEVVELLLRAHPAAAAAKDKEGSLPLHYACTAAENVAAVAALLNEFPLGSREVDGKGKLPLQIAIRTNAGDIERALRAVKDKLPASKGVAAPAGARPGGIVEKVELHPLHKAIESGKGAAAVTALLADNPDLVRELDSRGKLPLRVAIDCKSPVDVVGALLDAWPEAAREKDKTGKLPVNVALDAKADEAVVTELLRSALPIDPESGEPVPGPPCFGWQNILSRSKDAPLCVAAVEAVVNSCRRHIVKLAQVRDERGVRAVDAATPKCRSAILKILYICGRYAVRDDAPFFASPTCLVLLADDFGIASAAAAAAADGDAAAATVASQPVALKFVKSRKQFDHELKLRAALAEGDASAGAAGADDESAPVVPVLRSHDGFAQADLRAQLEQRGLSKMPYLLVLPAGSRLLAEVVARERFLPTWPAERLLAARQLTAAVARLHRAGVVHGDIKPRNVVRFDGVAGAPNRYQLSNLDCGARAGEPHSGRGSTALAPPELVYAVTSEGAPAPPGGLADAPPASPAQDAWALGATLFELVTGRSLLHCDGTLDCAVDDDDLEVVAQWRRVDKAWVLGAVADPVAAHLISRLLQRAPARRLSPADALRHPFFAGAVGAGALTDAMLAEAEEPDDEDAGAESGSDSGASEAEPTDEEVAAATEAAWAAVEAAAAEPVPSGWTKQRHETKGFYYTDSSGATQWTHPVSGTSTFYRAPDTEAVREFLAARNAETGI